MTWVEGGDPTSTCNQSYNRNGRTFVSTLVEGQHIAPHASVQGMPRTRRRRGTGCHLDRRRTFAVLAVVAAVRCTRQGVVAGHEKRSRMLQRS